ncbi:NAD-dependent epimerase/dehydratase family protein [Nonomuraea aridisoli]|uniref:Epimerase n=1 Tax=Nonomuraea aridisoli TaxID=2070368 RepID=A0A2W2FTA1_9ACTN|nr:NAD-dependent epimerase/dehydratase family protein [Nonomuraea aridisoli]PZG18214.1 epimerase [Nonomuraea aridisoli]
MSLVLVTGGSGFIAGHCILQLLERGHRVRTTVRWSSREAGVRAALARAGMTRGDALDVLEADLMKDDGWAAATRGADFVLHVASPVPIGRVKDDDDVIVPARDGALRVLRAAHDAGVKQCVLTSAFHAAGFGHAHPHGVFTEDDWSPLDGPGVDAYGKSKILSERAAWDFARSHSGLELTTILPVAVMGPVMGENVSGANHIVQRILDGRMPGYPNLYVPIVDVRDVAAAHVAAMTADGAAGERFLLAGDAPAMAMKQIGALLREHFGEAARKAPTRTIPDLVVRLAARVNPEFRSVAADLNVVKDVCTDKARRILGVRPRPSREAILAAAESMLARSLVTP